MVEINDRNLVDPFIELVAESWKVPAVFSLHEKKEKRKIVLIPSMWFLRYLVYTRVETRDLLDCNL